MKLQRDLYSCGVFATLNALRAMGTKVTEKRVRAHTATVRGKGTTEHAIKNALERLRFSGQDIHFGNIEEAFTFVQGLLLGGTPSLLYVDKDHWVAAVGVCGSNILVSDSENTKKNKAENGLHVYDVRKLAKRWLKCEDGTLYGIAIGRDA